MDQTAQVLSTTLPLMLREKVKEAPDIIIQYYKDNTGKFKPKTYRQFYDEVCFAGAGLLELGIKREDKVGIVADNRHEWMVCSFGILSIGAVDVPRGGDVTTQELSYIYGFTDCTVVFAENQKQVLKLLSCKADLPLLKTIISFDPVDAQTEEEAKTAGVSMLFFPSLCAMGQKRAAINHDEVEREMEKGKTDDTATIIFTSGTTGEPKGVMLSHENFLAQIPGCALVFDMRPGDIWLSVLAVWHVYERIVEYVIFANNNTIAYSKPIASVLMEDFKAIHPQFLATVPRVWESIMDAINRVVKAKGNLTKKAFDVIISLAKMYTHFKDLTFCLLPNFHGRIRPLDSIIGFFPWLLLLPWWGLAHLVSFRRVKRRLGSRFKSGFSGGGSLPAKVDMFFNSMGVRLQEVYGLTESAPFISARHFKKSRRGTIGQVLLNTQVKILNSKGKSLPPGRNGIIYAKGKQVMKGYFKKPELTASVLNDGWLNTGDIGMLTHNNELRITGRAKDTIVLRGGENVEPVPIEHKLRESPYIQQCMVVGQDKKYLAAIVVPVQQALMAFAEENNVPIVDYDLLLQQPEINELISNEIADRINLKTGFKPFERVFKFKLVPGPFEVGRELSTKMELLRHRINALYAKEIHGLFK